MSIEPGADMEQEIADPVRAINEHSIEVAMRVYATLVSRIPAERHDADSWREDTAAASQLAIKAGIEFDRAAMKAAWW